MTPEEKIARSIDLVIIDGAKKQSSQENINYGMISEEIRKQTNIIRNAKQVASRWKTLKNTLGRYKQALRKDPSHTPTGMQKFVLDHLHFRKNTPQKKNPHSIDLQALEVKQEGIEKNHLNTEDCEISDTYDCIVQDDGRLEVVAQRNIHQDEAPNTQNAAVVTVDVEEPIPINKGEECISINGQNTNSKEKRKIDSDIPRLMVMQLPEKARNVKKLRTEENRDFKSLDSMIVAKAFREISNSNKKIDCLIELTSTGDEFLNSIKDSLKC